MTSEVLPLTAEALEHQAMSAIANGRKLVDALEAANILVALRAAVESWHQQGGLKRGRAIEVVLQGLRVTEAGGMRPLDRCEMDAIRRALQ